MASTIAELTEFEAKLVKVEVGTVIVNVDRNGHGEVLVDGKPIRVKSISIEIDAGEPPVVFAELVP